jgi:hypothetical protein
MGSANANDRATIEAIYPREAFEADAAQNSRPDAAVLHGVLIASKIAESGAFALQRAKRHVGEEDPLGDTLFLAPFPRDGRASLQQTSAYGVSGQKPAGPPAAGRRAGEYADFIDRVLAAAAAAEFKDAIGQHEERLRGFRGG